MEYPWADPKIVQQCRLLSDSYKKWHNQPLWKETTDDKENSFLLYHAPFILVSHGTENDPVFNYANDIALKTWRMAWVEFVGLPSRFSGEPVETEDREKLLAEAQQKGYVSGYSGIRISKHKERFRISDTTLYNLLDEAGNYKGQAAMIPKWEYL